MLLFIYLNTQEYIYCIVITQLISKLFESSGQRLIFFYVHYHDISNVCILRNSKLGYGLVSLSNEMIKPKKENDILVSNVVSHLLSLQYIVKY